MIFLSSAIQEFKTVQQSPHKARINRRPHVFYCPSGCEKDNNPIQLTNGQFLRRIQF